jgi:hypothetical protein
MARGSQKLEEKGDGSLIAFHPSNDRTSKALSERSIFNRLERVPLSTSRFCL